MKKSIIISLVVFTLASSIAIGQIKPIKRGQKQKTEQTHKSKSSSTKSKINSSGNTYSYSSTLTVPAVVQQAINDMVYVQGGSFLMGATIDQGSNPPKEEMPSHQVTLSGYYICKYEVTQELWQAVMGNNPSYFNGSFRLPVECVSWDDCQEFINKLNQLTGKSFRLPTEAEWEFAARGGTYSKSYMYAGSNDIYDVAWWSQNAGSTTHEVGTKKPNELGLYDMSGNVLEWCQDWYGEYGPGSFRNPTGSISGYCRIRRGGCWNKGKWDCRVSCRDRSSSSSTGIHTGIRLAASSL